MDQRRLVVEVASTRQLTPAIREYVLRSAAGTPLPAITAGAHIAVHLHPKGAVPLTRHYSLIGGEGGRDDPSDTYRIAVQREVNGVASAHIHAMFAVGTKLEISPPRNEFPMIPMSPHSLLIAGGIGITPIYSMVRKLARTQRAFELHYCGRQRDHLAYADDLARLAGNHVTFHVTDGDISQRLDVRALLARQPEGTHVFVCGPGSLITATHDAAAALGIPSTRVHSELFSESSAESTRFSVRLQRSGLSVEVGPRDTILAALEAAGFPAISDCRRGQCGICPLPVLSADGPIEHRDTYLPPQDRASGRTLCICVSRLRGTELVLDA